MENKNKTKNLLTDKIAEQVKKDLKTPTKNIAKMLKTRREKLELSRASLYKISGVASSTIGDIENGKYLPHLEVVLKLAYALGIPTNDIINIFIQKSSNKTKNLREKSFDLIKLALGDMGFTELEIPMILEFIKFLGRNKLNLLDFSK